MRRSIAAAALVCSLLLACAVHAAGRVDREEGTIERISEGMVEIRGVRGLHVLELVGECSWCEEGLDVLITFRGYGRAFIGPRTRSSLGRPVQAFVVKDGREEG